MKNWIIVAIMAVAPGIALAGECPQSHCSKKSAELNYACKADGLAGQKIYYEVNGKYCWCKCSCFTEGTQIMTENGEVSVENLLAGDILNTPKGETSIHRKLVSPSEGESVLVFELENGRRLAVSTNHPMVLPGELIVEAKNIKETDTLMGSNGESIGILSISKVPYHGSLINFINEANSESGRDRIIIAEGVQTGDWNIQSYRDYLDSSVELRRLITQINETQEEQ